MKDGARRRGIEWQCGVARTTECISAANAQDTTGVRVAGGSVLLGCSSERHTQRTEAGGAGTVCVL